MHIECRCWGRAHSLQRRQAVATEMAGSCHGDSLKTHGVEPGLFSEQVSDMTGQQGLARVSPEAAVKLGSWE